MASRRAEERLRLGGEREKPLPFRKRHDLVVLPVDEEQAAGRQAADHFRGRPPPGHDQVGQPLKGPGDDVLAQNRAPDGTVGEEGALEHDGADRQPALLDGGQTQRRSQALPEHGQLRRVHARLLGSPAQGRRPVLDRAFHPGNALGVPVAPVIEGEDVGAFLVHDPDVPQRPRAGEQDPDLPL